MAKKHTKLTVNILSVIYWLLGTVSIYCDMFGIGYLLRLAYVTGWLLLAGCALTLVMTVAGMNKIDDLRQNIESAKAE